MSSVFQIELPDEMVNALSILSSSIGTSIEDILVDALKSYLDMMEEGSEDENSDYYEFDIPNAS